METGETSKTKTAIISVSSFLRSVNLHDWWLLKTNTNLLGVGGLAARERQEIRVFCSSAIVKRHDATTLETADGITITIIGFLNKSRTHQNGFPPEVCKKFLFGFPYHWQEFAIHCLSGESSKSGVPETKFGFEESYLHATNDVDNVLSASLDELPVTRVRDLFMSAHGNSETLTNGIFSDILRMLSKISNVEVSSTTTVDSETDRTPSYPKKAEVEKFKDKNSILDASDIKSEESKSNVHQSSKVVNDCTPRRGVLTRSMTRLKNLKNQLEGNLTSSTSKKQNTQWDSDMVKII